MAEQDIKGDKLQINSIESKEQVRIPVKNILTYAAGHELDDMDLIYKHAVEQLIENAPGFGNRFPTIIWTDDNDNEIARTTTDKNKLLQFFSATGELMFQLGPSTPVTPPVIIPPDIDIPFTLSENLPDFLELNLHFRGPDGSVLSDHYSEGSGLVGDVPGGVKPKSGQPMTIELTYYGGQVDSNNNLVTPWDGPVRVTLEVRKDGVWFDGFVKEFPTPPPVGSLGYLQIQPAQYASWRTAAKAERYTVPTTSEVIEPPVALASISFVGGTDTITDGSASFILDASGSTGPDGVPLTYVWTSDDPDVTFSAP